MQPTTEGRFRVLAGTRDRDEWLLLDAETGDPTYLPRTGHGDLDDAVRDLDPGNRVAATLAWESEDGAGDRPRVEALTVETGTLFAFVRDADPLFEAARECWRAAREAGEPMNSRVTHDTDADPNGVVYTFAEQPGEQDLFAEFRDGTRPLEPLLARLEESGRADPPYEVFVLDPEEACVVVFLALEKGGLLADTVRDTYDCPR